MIAALGRLLDELFERRAEQGVVALSGNPEATETVRQAAVAARHLLGAPPAKS